MQRQCLSRDLVARAGTVSHAYILRWVKREAAECTRCAQALNVGCMDGGAAVSGCVQARIAEVRGSAAEHYHANGQPGRVSSNQNTYEYYIKNTP